MKKPELKWVRAKPKKECVFITANLCTRNDPWEYRVWQIEKLEGYNSKEERVWYYGLLNGDGEEWGPLEDLEAKFYFIISAPETK